MRKLCYITCKRAQELCDKLNALGVEPAYMVEAGNGERVTAYYYADVKEEKKPEAPKEEKKPEAKEKPATAKPVL